MQWFERSRSLETLLPPETSHSLGVHPPVLAPGLGRLDINNLTGMSLGAAVLAHHLASEPVPHPKHGVPGLRPRHRFHEFSLGQTLL